MLANLIPSCLIFTLCSCELIISKINQMTNMDDLRPADNSSVVLSTSSVLQCAIECSNSITCESLSYHSLSRTCLLHPFLFNDTEGTINEDGWESYGERCYTKHGYVYIKSLAWCYRLMKDNKINASMAVDYCRMDGARMIRINSLQRHLHVTNLLHSRGVNSIWIGGQSRKTDNNFVYEDGTPLSYFFWASDDPKHNMYIRFVPMGNTFIWQNGKGNAIREFMCEY